jgi:hypothetical protein
VPNANRTSRWAHGSKRSNPRPIHLLTSVCHFLHLNRNHKIIDLRPFAASSTVTGDGGAGGSGSGEGDDNLQAVLIKEEMALVQQTLADTTASRDHLLMQLEVDANICGSKHALFHRVIHFSFFTDAA